MFASNPADFEFTGGNRKLIKSTAAHVKNIFQYFGDIEGMKLFMRKAIKETESMKGEETDNDNKAPLTQTHYFLNKLLETANCNSVRKGKNGFRYDDEIKLYATYIRMLAGRFAYETIQANLPYSLPSLPSTNRYIQKTVCNVIEGFLRCKELAEYLDERGLPRKVLLSEDGTRIEGRVQYDSSTNQITGFVLPIDNNGMPIPQQYPARNAEEIVKHFSTQNVVSSFVITIMAQPLANVPAFCLLLFGSDSKFTSNDVSKRWAYITNELRKHNIESIIIASDSDPKYNCAMRQLSHIGNIKNKWFSCDELEQIHQTPFFVQDPSHIGTKLRNYLLRTYYNKREIPFGKYFVKLEHIYMLLNKFSKDKHQLTPTVVNPIDKQNFESVRRICSEQVTNLLVNNVDNSAATVQFLTIVRDVIDSYMEHDLTPLERIKKIWRSVFLLRIWRKFIERSAKWTLKEIFLTSYCYNCIELNAHALVKSILFFKENNISNLFLPHLFGSQACESFYRQIRSFTSTYSTVANCSVKEILSRIKKIQMQNDIIHKTQSQFVYPRMNKGTGNSTRHELPNLAEILIEIDKCKLKAIVIAKNIGLIPKNKNIKNEDYLNCDINPYVPKKLKKTTKVKSFSSFLHLPVKTSQVIDLMNVDLKDYKDKVKEVSETSPYVKLMKNGKLFIVKKTTLCWLLRKDYCKISSDRLKRVQMKEDTQKQIKKNCLYSYKPLKKRKSNKK